MTMPRHFSSCHVVFGALLCLLAATAWSHEARPGLLREVGLEQRLQAQLPRRFDIAVADPPRKGLGAEGVLAVTSGRPRAIAYVACDPATFARDAALLNKRGYRLGWVQPIDMFPQTYHIELVGSFFLP